MARLMLSRKSQKTRCSAGPSPSQRLLQRPVGYHAAMPEHHETADPPSTPPHQRFRWLKRFLVLGLICFVLLLGLRLIWGHVMQSRLDQAIADIQAKGEPILFADLQNEPIPNADNGAWHLMQALQNWPSIPGQPGVNIHDTDWYIEGEEAGYTDPITDNAAYLQSCEPVLDTIRRGVAMQRSRWFNGPMPTDYNTFNNNFNHLGDTRRLARLMDDASRRAFDDGDPALGFEILLLIGQHGDQVGSQRLSIIDALVMISIHAMSYDYTSEHLAQLTDRQVRQPATRAALIALRDWLVDEGDSRQAFIECLVANRWSTHQYVRGIRDGNIPVQFWLSSGFGRLIIETPGLSFALRPMIDKSHAYALNLESEGIATFKASDNLRAMSDPSEPTFEETYEARPWLYPMFEELFFSDAVYRTYFRQLATRRMTAAAIAIRLYQADHGKRPDSLEALAPDYLASVPTDPYIGDQPIGYKPKGVVPKTEYEAGIEYASPISEEVRQALPSQPNPLLYCVGHDFQDNNGVLIVDDYDGTLQDYTSGGPGEDHWLLLVPEPEPVQALIDRYEDTYGLIDPWLDPLEGGEDEVEEQGDAGEDAEDEQPQPEPSEGQ